MALPFLPGNKFNENLGRVNYHRAQHFDFRNQVPLNVGDDKPGIGGVPRPGQLPKPNHSNIPRGSGPALPSWVAFDKQTLSFDAYFEGSATDRRDGQSRIHPCKIYFYPEDDSVQVEEPRNKNVGYSQGTVIRRHRIPRNPSLDNGQFFTVEDFNVGNEVTLYHRNFKITDCDDFTRNFLRKLGVRVGEGMTMPADPYLKHRGKLEESMQPLRPYEKRDTLKQFLDHDKHVLRFYSYWDDSASMYGEPHQMILYYFLADDTVEIKEEVAPNAGRDSTAMFLHRSKLPKFNEPLPVPGQVADRTVLNVFGPMGHGGRYILDSLKTGAVPQEFYTDRDLSIGTVFNVYGRKFTLCDCDEFTKEYYKTKYGTTDFTPIRFKDQRSFRRGGGDKSTPPYNGWGGEEDSRASANSLIPTGPKKDFVKFMLLDKQGLDGNVLRFLAKFSNPKALDAERRFIISFFLADDTIQVFEPCIRNSGILGGKFLERGRVKKPNQEQFGTEPPEYYDARDFFVGVPMEINKYRFTLIDADEYAYNFMEQNCGQFPLSNISNVMPKLRGLMHGAGSEIRYAGVGGRMPFRDFRQLLERSTDGRLTLQEIMTVARHYQCRADGTGGIDDLVASAQDKLKKKKVPTATLC